MNTSSNPYFSLRKQLVTHLKGGQAFAPIDQVIDDMPFKMLGIVPEHLPYSFYQQFYHIWFAQKDIIDYCKNSDYQAPDWPEDYWPQHAKPSGKTDWNKLVENFYDDRDALGRFIMDSDNQLFEPFASNPDHNLFREIQLIIEHNAYHTGQLYVIYRLLNP